MDNLKVLGKYLDQPKLVKKFSKTVPAVLIAGGGIYGVSHVLDIPKEERKKETIKTISVLATTILSALVAPKITSKLIKCHHHHHHDTAELIDDFLQSNKTTQKTREILIKSKNKILNFDEIKTIFNELESNPKAKEFLSGDEGLIPDPERIDSTHIFKEDVKRLSVLGLIPVLGGITGGIIGDKLTEKNWKEKIPNKVKEGSYQYFANIFLCNIGAGIALAAMEKAKIKSKSARAIGMIGGILLTGVVFGSAMANFIGEKVIDPLVGKKHNKKGLYVERKPEVLDISLHVDDVATVAVLSGLKWIEPALPILYSISGYRAGIGYRNGENR